MVVQVLNKGPKVLSSDPSVEASGVRAAAGARLLALADAGLGARRRHEYLVGVDEALRPADARRWVTVGVVLVVARLHLHSASGASSEGQGAISPLTLSGE